MLTRTRALLLAATLIAVAAAPALAGPPWIAAEYPVNPHHPDTRGALMLVHTFHHGTAMQYPVTGVLEGIVNGKRQTIRVTVKPTYRDGVFAVRGKVPAEGNWVLVLSMAGDESEPLASLIATLSPRGEIFTVNVPNGQKDGWTIPRAATPQDIDAALRGAVTLARLASAGTSTNANITLAGIGLIGLLLLGADLRRKGCK